MVIRIAVIMAIQLIACSMLTGCAGEVYAGFRRIDEVQQTQVMKDKPLKCLFVDCNQSTEK